MKLLALLLSIILIISIHQSDARRRRRRICRNRYGNYVRCSQRIQRRPEPEPEPTYGGGYGGGHHRPNRREPSRHGGGIVYPGGGGGGGGGSYPTGTKQKGRKCSISPEGLSGICKSATYCYFQYNNIKHYSENICKLPNGAAGICCPDTIIPPSAPRLQIQIPRRIKLSGQIPRLSIKELDQAANESKTIVTQQLRLEKKLVEKGLIQLHNTAEAYLQAFFGGPDETLRLLARNGLIGLETTIQIAKRYHLLPHQARDGLQYYSLYETSIKGVCSVVPRCHRSKYRTIDGSCNNLDYPLWGRSNTAFVRLVPPAYADGLNELRVSVSGGALPGPREVSTTAALDADIPHQFFTLVVMQWGQFIDHDLTLTASTRVDSPRGEGLSCCREELVSGRFGGDFLHPACKPIDIPHNDAFFSRHRQTCMNFVRNAPAPRAGCKLGHREQLDQLTQFIDGSMVYGSTDEVAKLLRSFKRGQMKYEVINGVEYLPFDMNNRSEECAARGRIRCFAGGDVRVNEQTGLTTMHMLWLREHNRIAKILENLNPHWSDEQLYQETRRIIGAQIQHITINEWSPLVLGRRVMKEFDILLKPDGYRTNYNPKIHPGIMNSFATAAYRFHSLIQGTFKLMNSRGSVEQRLMLKDLFNNPTSLYRKGAFDGFLRALTGQPIQTFDGLFTDQITNHLFQEHEREFGMDLIALNIQRGRDHGLPGYNAFRYICGLPIIRTWHQLDRILRRGSARKLQRLYKYIDDIDLFIGGNHERPLPGALLGPTLACIVAEQTRRHLIGDRFWYENKGMKHSFNQKQIDELRKVSLASVICNNADNINSLQQLAFYQENRNWNPAISCKKISHVNFEPWQGERAE